MSSPAERLNDLPSGPGGRPTDYTEEYCHIAHEMYAAGATPFELAERLGCNPRTMYRWAADHPEFRQSMKLGRETADQRVEDSLYHRAVGYTYPAVKIFKSKDEDPVVVPYIEHVPPDVAAATLWLSNRRSKDWKQVKTLEVKSDKSDIETIDSILARFTALKAALVEEGEVIEGTGHAVGSDADSSPVPRLSSDAHD